jgi:hypothetical protein
MLAGLRTLIRRGTDRGAIDLLRHDALGAKPAGVRKDDRAVLGDMFIEQEPARALRNSRASAALRSRNGRLRISWPSWSIRSIEAKIVPSRDNGHLADGTLSLDRRRVGWMAATAALGQQRTLAVHTGSVEPATNLLGGFEVQVHWGITLPC